MKEIFFMNKSFNLFLFFSNLYFIVLKDCDKAKPILKDNDCQLIYCEQAKFNTNECSINNPIIKAQWLNNIIRISDNNFRYINVVSNKNGDFFIETSPITEGSKRIFYGLKKNGRPYFKNEETPFYILDELGYNLKRHYSELINIVLNNNKEYLMSISTDGYAEIYDFDNNQRKYLDYPTFIQMNKTYSSILNYGCAYEKDSNYYIIYPFYVYSYYNEYGKGDYLYFHRFHFKDTIDISKPNSYDKQNSRFYLNALHGKIVSCFKSTNYIYCLFHHYDFNYLMNIYDLDINYIGYFNYIEYYVTDLYSFFKGVLLKDEIIAIYYYPPSLNNHGCLLIVTSPTFNDFSYGTPHDLNNIITINTKVQLNNQLYYNDFIKIDENRLCITSVSGSNTQKMYIIIVNLFNEYKNARIYYYSIEFYNLYHFNVYGDVKLYLYNNYISYSSCVCNEETCNDSVPFYSTLILFSYPNCSDTSIDLIEYLSNNTMNVNDFEINLTEYFKIDNNIFGYVFDCIKIISIFKNYNLKLIKKRDNNTISNFYELEENEILKLSYDETEILKGDYKIEYAGVVTKPDLYDYGQYAEDIDQQYQGSESYNEDDDPEYTGKTAYYIINVVEDLSSDCINDCQLCYKINKTCIYKSDDIITNSISITNEQTDEKTIENTNVITDIKTTEKIIDENTTENKNYSSDSDFIYDSSDSLLNISDGVLFKNNCTIEDIMNNGCNQKINPSQINKTYKQIKKDILNEDYNKGNVVIKTDNVAFQISKYDDQNSNNMLSHINIGKCEEIIRKKYNIAKEDSLILLKADIKNANLTSTYVQYEIYNPYNLSKIDLDICQNTTTIIKTPTKLKDETISLYDNMQEQGYNLFNSSDSFYHDICTRYTTEYGTDMIISDRKQILDKYNDVPLCQDDCTFEYYNISSNVTTCSCPMQIKNITLELIDILFGRRDILKGFYISLSYSNFRVMKCYKLLLNKNGLIKNIGSYILFAIIIIFFILINIYFFVEKKEIKKYIGMIIKEKYLLASRKYKELKDKKKKHNKNPKEKDIFQPINIKVCKRKNKKSLTANSKSKSEKYKCLEIKSPKRTRRKERVRTVNLNDKKETKIIKTKSYFNKDNHLKFNKDAPPKRNKIKKNIIEMKNLNISLNEDKSSNTRHQIKHTSVDIFSYPNSKNKLSPKKCKKEIYNTRTKIFKNKKGKGINKYNSLKDEKPEKKVNFTKKYNNTHSFGNNQINPTKLKKIIVNNDFSSMTEFELDLLDYKIALKIDKRRTFNFYWSFLKRGNLILFAVMPYNDYNLRTVKISLLLISFSLYFTINGFFFTDYSMHKIYANNGKYNLANQIPQMIYSILISTSVNSLLKLISLPGKDIILIKQQPTIEFALVKSKSVEKCLTIKIIIYYIISLFCLFFYWYFISCFCAVYINTQLILIHDTLFSFATSMIYPFGFCLLPTFMRSIALKSDKKDKKCLYNTSLLIS